MRGYTNIVIYVLLGCIIWTHHLGYNLTLIFDIMISLAMWDIFPLIWFLLLLFVYSTFQFL